MTMQNAVPAIAQSFMALLVCSISESKQARVFFVPLGARSAWRPQSQKHAELCWGDRTSRSNALQITITLCRLGVTGQSRDDRGQRMNHGRESCQWYREKYRREGRGRLRPPYRGSQDPG